MTTRRGFLRALLAGVAAPVVAKATPLAEVVQTPTAALATPAGTAYESLVFRSAPKFFDVITYTGNGTSLTVPNSLGFKPSLILVKNRTIAQDWMMLDCNQPALPPEANLDGHSYIAYEFGEDALKNIPQNLLQEFRESIRKPLTTF